MIDRLSNSDCTLCGSCRQICSVNAISFTDRDRDFNYPQIDESVCIKCNKCEKACPVLSFRDRSDAALKRSFIGRNKDVTIRKKSTSGGIFYAMAKWFVENNGYVAGAVLMPDFTVKHVLADQPETIKEMIGSKYANSDTGDVYQNVYTKLKAGKKVLFTGCPCQIAALNTFIEAKGNIAEDNLYLMEVVCHGIPSNTLLKEYIKLHEKKARSKVKAIQFRDKTVGWHSSSVKIDFENGYSYREPITVDAYMSGFLSGATMKECCYTCKFHAFKSCSDFMLGDFWGAEAEVPELDDNTGLSGIIINSNKAIELIKNLPVEVWDYDIDSIIKYNKNILESTVKNPVRDDFYAYAAEHSYGEAIEKFFWESDIARLKRMLRFRLRTIKHRITRKGNTLY